MVYRHWNDMFVINLSELFPPMCSTFVVAERERKLEPIQMLLNRKVLTTNICV